MIQASLGKALRETPVERDPAGSAEPPKVDWRIVLLCIGAMSFLEGRLLFFMEQSYLPGVMADAQNLLAGRPEWLADQSRILGPLIVSGLAHATGLKFSVCYVGFSALALFGANLLCYWLFLRLSRSNILAWVYTLAYCAAFLVCQRNVLYLWDYIGMFVSLLFAYLIFTRAKPIYFVLLFLVAVLNRESAAYLGIWLFLDAWRPLPGKGSRISLNAANAGIGLVLVLCSIGWSHLIRKLLYVHQTGITGHGVRVIGGQLFTLPFNIQQLEHPFHRDVLFNFPIILIIGLGLTALLFKYHQLMLRRAIVGPRALPLAILLALMFIDNLTFGAITAVRIWLEMLPFMVFLAYMVFEAATNETPVPRVNPAVGNFIWSASATSVEKAATTGDGHPTVN